MTPEQEKLLSESVLLMLRRLPYFGTFAIGMDRIPDLSVPTACTDGSVIRFNPEWLLGSTALTMRPREEVVFVLAHEVLHCSFKHMLRMGYRDPSLSNVAMDYAINLILHEGSVGKMPEPDASKGEVKLLDAKYKNMSWETIYDLLEKERQAQGGGKKIKIGGVILDLSKPDPGGTGGVVAPVNVDGSGLSEGQKADLERDLDGKTSSAAAAAKSQGKLPAGLERFLTSAMKPIIDWRDRLRQFVSKQFPADYSWSRPNRRHLWQDLYLPHVTKEGVGEILCIMDTSGSVAYDGPRSEGAQYWAEIRAIFEDVVPEKLHVMYCDSNVAGYDVFEPGDDLKLRPKGGGGTDFRPPFRKVEKDSLQIQCAIYLTDMMGTFPEKPAPYPVMWIATTDSVAPWGETVPLKK